MRVRQHALSVFFAAIFLAALAGQALTGLALTNEEQASHGLPSAGLGEYLLSSQFVVDVAENWQSEYLQFFLFILTTIWLVQRGSPESKKPGDEGVGSDESQLVGRYARPDSPAWARADGWRRWLFSNSLLLVMGAVFLLSWLAQSIAGMVAFNAEQAEHGQAAVDWLGYAVSADFWNRTLQNWQSEFLAVGSMVAFSIFLRQRGSSESKPVGAPHEASAVAAE
ncbi:DUF6766 family protein [Agromyces mediolanus]|uniref:Transmembrane protein n=1 Tax=Agromyces mediolanus TaxID=41986 RepID=A0A918CCT6_AGRME|nr:DUF6766 family protein [Agromyces mediolanus]GGR17130.1 hypothetical protein GCM10010196_07370 [Agromyces mediolanus]GLJ71651.1 hypothetical protein GCM10017583_09070 [Agromyces mediolanus]